MDEYFDRFASGPRTARRNHKTSATTQVRASRVQPLDDEFFSGFFAGPRASL